MYEFHGIKWLQDDELDQDSPERRGPGWAHAYVPIIGPTTEEPATAHVPIYMPRVYKELKRFALQVYKAAGGTTKDVEFSGWWSSVKSAFKTIARVVANNKVLRTLAERGVEAAIPGGPAVTATAKAVGEQLISKYRGGDQQAAAQIKGVLEKSKAGDEQSAKVLEFLRREYVKQQAAGLPALLTTTAAGDVVIWDPVVGVQTQMTKDMMKRLAEKRKKQAAQRKAAAKQKPQGRGRESKSPLRNRPQGPQLPGTRATQMRQGQLPPGVQSQQTQLQQMQQRLQQMRQQGVSPGYPQDYGYPQGYPPDYGYPQGYGYPSSYPQDYGYPPAYDDGGATPAPSYESPEQEARDEEDLQAAQEEQDARMYAAQMYDEMDEQYEGASAGAAYKPTMEEAKIAARLSPADKAQLKTLKGKDAIQKFLREKSEKQKTDTTRTDERQAQKRRARDEEARRKQQEMMRRTAEQQKRSSQTTAQKLQQMQKNVQKDVQMRSAASKRVGERRREQDEYKAQLDNLRGELDERDIADEKRGALETQAAQYEQLIVKAEEDIRRIKAVADIERARAQQTSSAAPVTPSMAPPSPPPVLYDEETDQELDTDDPLVRETLRNMRLAAEIDAENDEG